MSSSAGWRSSARARRSSWPSTAATTRTGTTVAMAAGAGTCCARRSLPPCGCSARTRRAWRSGASRWAATARSSLRAAAGRAGGASARTAATRRRSGSQRGRPRPAPSTTRPTSTATTSTATRARTRTRTARRRCGSTAAHATRSRRTTARSRGRCTTAARGSSRTSGRARIQARTGARTWRATCASTRTLWRGAERRPRSVAPPAGLDLAVALVALAEREQLEPFRPGLELAHHRWRHAQRVEALQLHHVVVQLHTPGARHDHVDLLGLVVLVSERLTLARLDAVVREADLLAVEGVPGEARLLDLLEPEAGRRILDLGEALVRVCGFAHAP